MVEVLDDANPKLTKVVKFGGRGATGKVSIQGEFEGQLPHKRLSGLAANLVRCAERDGGNRGLIDASTRRAI